jgi:hypothetical protein
MGIIFPPEGMKVAVEEGFDPLVPFVTPERPLDLLLKAEFLDSKDKIALTRGWAKVVLEIQLKFNVNINMVQVKSKYQSLQKQYQVHNAADKQTGNAPQKTSLLGRPCQPFWGSRWAWS